MKITKILCYENLVLYGNPTLPIKLGCDASSMGIETVLSHQLKDNTDRPIVLR